MTWLRAWRWIVAAARVVGRQRLQAAGLAAARYARLAAGDVVGVLAAALVVAAVWELWGRPVAQLVLGLPTLVAYVYREFPRSRR